MHKTDKALSSALMIFSAGVLWSFAGVLSRLTTWSPLTLVGARGLIAVVILGIARKNFRAKLGPAEWIGAASLCATSLLFMSATRMTTAANAIVLQYAMPIFILLYNVLIRKHKPSRSQLITVAFVLLGICLCFAEGIGGGAFTGDLLALLSALTYATLFISSQSSSCDSLDLVYLGNALSCCFLITIPFDPGFTLSVQNLLVWLGMGSCLGFGYLFFAFGMRKGISPISAAIIANVEPVLNPTWAFVFLGENPGTLAIVGACIVLTVATVRSLQVKNAAE